MHNFAYTPCNKCFANQLSPTCCLGLDQEKDENGTLFAPGWCRAFRKNMTGEAHLPTKLTALIYFDETNNWTEFNATVTSLIRQQGRQIKNWVILDNSGKKESQLPKLIDSYKFYYYKFEQRLEPDTSFEKAIDVTIRRFMSQDLLIALKSGSVINNDCALKDFSKYITYADRHIFWEFDSTQGIYLREAFLQLGGGESFVSKLLYFKNSSDLIEPMRVIDE